MPNWVKLFEGGVLEKCGTNVGTMRELAEAVSKEAKESVSTDAIFNAHKRHRQRLGLKKSLTEYFGKGPEKVVKQPKVKPEDIYYKLSRDRRREVKKAKKFIITSAMNNCPLDEKVWASVENYAKENDASIIVIPVRYKNPTGWTSMEENQRAMEDAWWPDEVEPYATDECVKLHEHLWVMGHVRVQATAVTPLSGLEALSKHASAVFGHANLQMKMVATPQKKLPKLMYTTGSVSKPYYSDSRAGVKGEFHHGMGAVVVELDGPRFHARAVVADRAGGFYDLNKYYGPKGVKKSKATLALITGDEHAMFNDKRCRGATYDNKDSIVNTLKPAKIVRHDIFDGYSVSHWNRTDPVIQFSKHKEGHHKLEEELKTTLKFLEETTPKWAENLIVSSNHDDFLIRWMKSVNAPIQEPWNARLWHELWGVVLDSVEFKEHGVSHVDPFASWIKKHVNVPCTFLGSDSDYRVADVAVGLHGDKGTNGSRGTINQFAKLGVKTVIGHSHTPGIKHGCYQVGTSSTLKLDYTKGPSSWAHCHAVIYPNGKRQLIFVVNGHWKA